jgi:hypothetical protein
MEVDAMNRIHVGPSLMAAFLGSLVECGEPAMTRIDRARRYLRKRPARYMVAGDTQRGA